jgi:hypothetical protein
LINSLHNSVSIPNLRNVYFTKSESVLKYGIIFWEGVVNDSNAVFKIQKKGIRLINPMESGLNAKFTAVKAGFKIPLNDLTLVHRGRHTSLGFMVSAVHVGGTRYPTIVG